MASIYEIEYKFEDELNESGWRTSNLCVYDSSEVGAGETIQYALDKANEDDDWSGVDKLMGKLFGLKDDDIAFYFDRNGVEDGGIISQVERDFDIIINDYHEVKL